MIVYQDLLSQKDVASDSYPRKDEAKGTIIALESKKITVGDSEDAINKAIGANESKEEGAGEKMDEVKEQVINIVHAHNLVKLEFKDGKEFKAVQAKYWKSLKTFMDQQKFAALGLGADYKAPADKKAAADAEKAAEGKLDKAGKLEVKGWVDRLDSFKTNYPTMAKFVDEDICKNFTEYEFYIANDAEMGSCLIVPARYVGEALSPTFYLWTVGIKEDKF
jgi:hypothetical protein